MKPNTTLHYDRKYKQACWVSLILLLIGWMMLGALGATVPVYLEKGGWAMSMEDWTYTEINGDGQWKDNYGYVWNKYEIPAGVVTEVPLFEARWSEKPCPEVVVTDSWEKLVAYETWGASWQAMDGYIADMWLIGDTSWYQFCTLGDGVGTSGQWDIPEFGFTSTGSGVLVADVRAMGGTQTESQTPDPTTLPKATTDGFNKAIATALSILLLLLGLGAVIKGLNPRHRRSRPL